MSESAIVATLVFLFGLSIGSFLNVCIRRIPAGLSVVRPASRCPKCQSAIQPYDNIPVISYLVLGGKCRACRAPISPVYPLVELLTGALFLACFLSFGLSAEFAKWAIFSSLLVVLVFTDILERVLPDLINYSGLGAGLALSLMSAPADGSAQWLSARLLKLSLPAPAEGLGDALVGAAVGGGTLWVVAEGYFRLRGREGMGFGDVKMMAMAGAFLGVKKAMLTILVGSLLGSILGLLFIAAFRKDTQYELPFGTFLGAGALVTVFYGSQALAWYRSLFV